MTLHALGSKDRISRREFLKIIRLKKHGMPLIDKEKCTGCGLCTIDCPTKALTIYQNSERDTYQLLFREETCNACGVCEKSCPENCFQWVEKKPEKNQTGKSANTIFEDEICRCMECGIPLFPRSMVRKLESKILMNRETTWPFNLCPSCRMKTQFMSSLLPLAKGGAAVQSLIPHASGGIGTLAPDGREGFPKR